MRFTIIIAAVLFKFVYSLSCRDENGHEVDWFIVYKIPLLQDDPSKLLATGYSYAFMTGDPLSTSIPVPDHVSNYLLDGWKLSDKLITDDKSIFGQTIGFLYQNTGKDSFVMYNDQMPESFAGKSSSSSLAHAKGILAMDGETGFWMIHTVPRFAEPVSTGKYVYPASGKENGQTAMCISFHTKAELDNIMTQLLCIHPNVYDSHISDEISRITPKITDLISRHWPKKVSESTRQISSKNGQLFTSFARNSKSHYKELYLEIVAPGLGSDLLVETWRRGAGDPLPSNCSYKYKVNNVESVELKFEPGAQVRQSSPWKYNEDHSKWAVAIDQPAACLGDINRMASQYKRGGGSLCMRNPRVWEVMKNSIHTTEPCPMRPDGRHQSQSNGSTERWQRNKSPVWQEYLMVFTFISYLLSFLLSAGNNCDL